MLAKKYMKILKNKKLNLSYNGLINQNEIFDKENENKENETKKSIENSDICKDERFPNPLCGLLDGQNNLNLILENKDMSVLEYLYLNRFVVHQLLYEGDTIIKVELDYISGFKDYYYLYLLIKEEPEINNYNYDFSFVKKAFDFQTETEKEIEKIIRAKIALTLIKVYTDQNEENQEDCKKMEKSCKDYLIESKNILDKYKIEIDLDKLYDDDIHINEIYIGILKYLIINQKLDESTETSNLLNELDLKNLRINKDIFEALKEVLTEKNLQNYKIETFDDLFQSEKKLIFYYTLFEYILKDYIYIYEIPFLIEQRNNIIKIIKENLYSFYSEIKDGEKDTINKLKKVLGFFIEFDYYYEKSKKLKKYKKKESMSSNNNYSSNNQSNNSINSNNNMPSQNSSSSNFHSSNSSSGENPFDKDSYKNRGPQGLSFFSESGEREYEKDKDIAYLILTNSEFIFKIKYDKEQHKAKITFTKISYTDKNEETNTVSYDDIFKIISSEDTNINSYFDKFKQYLKVIEKDISDRYKIENEIEIILSINLKSEKNNKLEVNSNFCINDNKKRDENNFADQDILESNTHTGLGCLLDEICEDK